MELPLGWWTDLAVLRLSGSRVEEYADHLLVRTPANPTYHWGNFVLVTDPGAVDDAERWLHRFEDAFPDAAHRAIGLVAEPTDDRAWLDATLFLERADVLVTHDEVPPTPIEEGYQVRVLDSPDDWARSTALRQLAFPGQEAYEERVTATRVQTALTWFGAFAGDDLAAELGIARCGDRIARYQSVLTHPEHRRRGLTRHLLGVAAAHARGRGAERLVIVADADTAAARLYRAAGFELDSTATQVSRMPGIVVPGLSPER